MNRRLLLGLIAVGLLVTGVTLWFFDRNHELCGPCIRVGLVLLAAWFAYRDVERIPVWMLGALLLAVAVIAWRPRMVVIVVPAMVALWFLRPRPGKT